MFTRIVSFLLITLTLVLGRDISLKFDKLSSEDGLSQNSIYDIIQDNQGYMWFATQDGLNRFDGYNFKIFRQDNSSTAGGVSNYINTICQSSLNEIWIGSITGLAVLNAGTSHFKTLKNVPNLAGKNISKIIQAADSSIWVGAMGAGISHLTPDGRLIDTFLLYTDSLYAQKMQNVKTLFEDMKGNIWVGTDNGGLFTILASDSNRVLAYPNLNFLERDKITAISQSDGGNIWIGTAQHGVYILGPNHEVTKNFTNVSNNSSSLSGNVVKAIYKNHDHQIWIGTEDGLSVYRPGTSDFQNFHHDPDNLESLSNNSINAITMDKSGIIWIGTNNRGINRFSPFYTFFTNYQMHTGDSDGLSSNIVWAFSERTDGHVWLGTDDGLDLFDPIKNKISKILPNKHHLLSHNTIRRIFIDHSNRLWLGTDGGGINIYDPRSGVVKVLKNDPLNPNSLSSNRVRDIVQDNDGTIWVATLKGLNRYNPETNNFSVFKSSANNKSGLSDDRILDLFVDSHNKIWLATYSSLNCFDKSTSTFKQFSGADGDSESVITTIIVSIYKSPHDPDNLLWIGTSNGLNRFNRRTGHFDHYLDGKSIKNHVIYSISEDIAGYLWLSTGHGLLRFDRKTASVKSFDTSAGLLNDEFNASASLRLSNNKLVFGGVKGITYFNPLDIPDNNIIPNIVITSFKKYDTEVNIDSLILNGDELQLSYKDNFISLEFAALDYTNASNNQYKYKLEGFNSDWIDNGSRRFVSYTNLDGGHYTFRVIGTNNDGVWNKIGASVKLNIIPPFWETSWFRILFIIFLGIIIRTFFNVRISRINAQKEHLQQEVNKRTKELYRRNIDLKKAQREQATILRHVEEGFFLLDTNFIIQSQFSAALKQILQVENPGGKHLIEIIRPYLRTKDVDTVVEYLDILGDPEIDEELIENLNPLSQCELIFPLADSQMESRYLAFNFKRIYQDKQLVSLIVTVVDETEEYKLKQKLSESEENAKRQMEWIMGILHLEPDLLLEFIQSTYDELEQISSILDADVQESEFQTALIIVGRSLHLIKGNANLLDLVSFGTKIHEAEDQTKKLMDQKNLTGGDFLNLVAILNSLRYDLDELSELLVKIKRFNHPDKKQNSQDSSVMLKSLENMISRISNDKKIKVKFDYTDLHSEHIPPQLRLIIKNILVQLVRNSLSHGIEPPDERIALGKSADGCINLSSVLNDSLLKICYSDDGRGLQLGILKEKALASGLWATQDVQSWGEHQLEEVIFVPGISSAEAVDMTSGRGVGMDLIRDRIQSHGGKIGVDSKESEYCKFEIILPITHIN